MKRLLTGLVSIGLKPSSHEAVELSPRDARFTRVTNITLAIAVIVAFLYVLLSWTFIVAVENTGRFLFLRVDAPPPGMFSLTMVNLIFLGIYLSIYIPAALRLRRVTKIALFLAVMGHIACTAVFMGPGAGVDLYLMITAFFPFMVFSRVEWRFLPPMILGLVAVYILTQYLYARVAPLSFSRETMRAVYFMNVSAMFCVVIALSAFYLAANANVEEKLERERGRSDRLLLNVLPEPIAHRLKDSERIIADSFENAGVLFADLVGFTSLSQRVSPRDLVVLLNEIFSAFDDMADRHGLEKIKTIGDAYMVAAGLPEHRRDHVRALAAMALDMRDYLADFRVLNFEALTDGGDAHNRSDGTGPRDEGGPPPLAIRIGINVGPVVAGVIGKKKFIYDLWGDSVNTAARMESHGLPGSIQVTETVREMLGDDYRFQDRGEIHVKGKGNMRTYLLLGRSA